MGYWKWLIGGILNWLKGSLKEDIMFRYGIYAFIGALFWMLFFVFFIDFHYALLCLVPSIVTVVLIMSYGGYKSENLNKR